MSRRLTAPPNEPVTESYLESLSDLLVGLLFIFIIVLMSFSLDLRIAQQANKQVQTRLSDAALLRAELLTSIRSRMSRAGVFMDIDERNGILRLPESLLFGSGSAQFNEQGREKVAMIARELALELPCYATGAGTRRHCPKDAHPVLDAVFIEGHTDNVPITGGPFANNWDLSAARSRNTYLALVQSAPELTSIRNDSAQPLLSISAYGDSRPLHSYRSLAENQKHSSRIDLRFIVGTPRLEALHE